MDGPIAPAPDGIGPLAGYRLWKVHEEGDEPVFSSLSFESRDWVGASHGWVSSACSGVSEFWVSPEGELEWPDPHQAPGETCTCGFYAMKELTPELRLWASFPIGDASPGSAERFVLGRVELAGKVIEHEFGYRAERARIVELIPIWGGELGVQALARRIGVPAGQPVGWTEPPDAEQQRERARALAATLPTPRSPDVGILYGILWVTASIAFFAAFATAPSDPWSSGWRLVWIACMLMHLAVRSHREATISERQ
jgi:hypothetical protein